MLMSVVFKKQNHVCIVQHLYFFVALQAATAR